jgi:site-specific DNA recombinase
MHRNGPLEEYCRLYGLEVADVHADDGISGTIPLHERPEGRRLLQDAREGKFQMVLVYRLDRLGRSLLVIVDAHDRLQNAGVSLRSATEPIDTSTPSGRLTFQMLASFAEYERETIRERTRAGMHRDYRSGRNMGVVPYGYRANEHGRLQVVAEEAELVREVVSNVAGGSTLYAEAKRLNDLGIPAPGWRYVGGKRRPGSASMVRDDCFKVRPRAGLHRHARSQDQRRRGPYRAAVPYHSGTRPPETCTRSADPEQALPEPRGRPQLPPLRARQVRGVWFGLHGTPRHQEGKAILLLRVPW